MAIVVVLAARGTAAVIGIPTDVVPNPFGRNGERGERECDGKGAEKGLRAAAHRAQARSAQG